MKSHSTIRYWICYLLLFVVLLVLFVGTLCTGSVPFSLSEIGSVLMHPEQNTTAWKILWEIRMPRSLTAIILGGALSVSGFLLQTFFSNPIAGPYILGISSGAKLTVALAMIFFLGQGRLLSAMALIGVAFFWVYALYGVYPVDFRESSSNVHSDYLWGYDWLYLFCNH